MKTNLLKICILLTAISMISVSPNIQPNLIVESSATTDTIMFSGYEWNVKNSNGALWGPGPNLFNDSIQNVWVDSNGSLHLRITHGLCIDQWYCAEVYSVQSFGYGTYNFTLAPGFETLDKNVVLGLFTYLDDLNEIDIEFAKWGQETTNNGQYVLQPSWKPNHIERFEFEPQGEDSVHGFTWCKNSIDFWSFSSFFEFNWRYYGLGIPQPSTEHVNMNLWLMQGLAPSDYTETEVVIKSFEFIPSECSDSPLSFWWVLSFSLVGFVAITATVILLVFRKKRKNHSKILN